MKNKHRYIVDISESRASLTGALFFINNKELGKKSILGQPPSILVRDQVSEDSETYEKNKHRHIVDISESRSSPTGGLFFSYNAGIGPDSVDFEKQPSTGSFIRPETQADSE